MHRNPLNLLQTVIGGLLCTLSAIPVHAQTSKVPEKIDVLVVDHRGRPVQGVLVRTVWRVGGSACPGLRTKRTDRSGRVRVHPVKRWIGGWKLFVEPSVPMKPPVRVAIDLKMFVNDPKKPVRVELPPYGSVRVKVLDKDGKHVTGVEDVYMRYCRNPQAKDYGDPSLVAFVASRHGTWDGYFATFPFVAVGLKTEVWCKIGGRHLPAQRVDGPRHPLDMALVKLKGISGPPGFMLRLAGMDGKPIESERIGLIFTGGTRVRAETAYIGKGGQLHVSIPTYFTQLEEAHVVLVRRGKSATEHLGAVRLSIPKSLKQKDLGNLKLRAEPILVAGRILDTAGKPVQGAVVSVKPHYMYMTGSVSIEVFEAWKFLYHRVVTGANGRFEFRELGENPISLDIAVECQFGEPIDGYAAVRGGHVNAGTKDHEVVVVQTTFISGSIAGVAADKTTRFGYSIRDERGQPVRGVYLTWFKGGKFKLRNCPPGKYSLGFSLRLGQKSIRTFDDVVVEEGKPCEDPRLRNIDLTKSR